MKKLELKQIGVQKLTTLENSQIDGGGLGVLEPVGLVSQVLVNWIFE